jgi:hypothetical protein
LKISKLFLSEVRFEFNISSFSSICRTTVVKSVADRLEVGTVDADSANFSLETVDLAEPEASSGDSMIDAIPC